MIQIVDDVRVAKELFDQKRAVRDRFTGSAFKFVTQKGGYSFGKIIGTELGQT